MEQMHWNYYAVSVFPNFFYLLHQLHVDYTQKSERR
jgi:hypothetical protein